MATCKFIADYRLLVLAKLTIAQQLLLPVCLHHRLHALPARHCIFAQRTECADHRKDTRLQCARSLVACGWRQHSGWQWRREEQGLAGRVPALRFLRWFGLSLLHLLADFPCTVL